MFTELMRLYLYVHRADKTVSHNSQVRVVCYGIGVGILSLGREDGMVHLVIQSNPSSVCPIDNELVNVGVALQH